MRDSFADNKMVPTPKTTVRRERVRPTVGKMRDVMPGIEIPKGYVGRWFNDVNDRIFQKIKHGWDFLTVNQEVKMFEQGVKDAKQSGDLHHKNVGAGLVAYLMVIRENWYQEDRDAYHESVSIVKKNIDKEAKNTPGVYGGIEVTEKTVA